MGELNPAQQNVLDRLGKKAAPGEEFPAELGPSLRHELSQSFGPIAVRLTDPLFLNKHVIGMAMGCEKRFLAERATKFAWSPPTARGTIAHKAIELSVHRLDELAPPDLVDEAMASIGRNDTGLGDWLQTCGDTVRAEVRSEAVARVAAFVELWPALPNKWRPVLESSSSAEFCASMIILRGKTDLTIGTPAGRTAGKVIVDMKTGRYSPDHVSDLRYYALLETMKIGVPPRMLATSYLDSGELHTEAVTEDMLWSQVHRVIDAAGRIATLLAEERDPVIQPGPPCWWCPVQATCEPGIAWIAEKNE